MKANELMIGDFFLYNGNVVEIVSIDGGTETVWIDSEKISALRKVDDLQPILLTSKILEKNGFVKAPMVSDTPPYDKDEEGNMHFSLNESFWGWWQPNNTFLIPANGLGWLELKYVHEIQHALNLCRIDPTR